MTISANFPNVKPSLLLDFANAKQLPPSVTFTRSTPAVYYDGKTTAMAEQNIFQQSQTFDNAYWNKFQATITANSTTAPDGTNTADTFTEGTSTIPSLYVNAGDKKVNEIFTLSIYAKANGRNYFSLKQRAANDDYIVAIYDLSAPSVSKTQAGTNDTIISTSITSVGNGWYRLTLTGSIGGTLNAETLFGLSDTGTPTIDTDGNHSYTGDGTSGAYVWGAQLEARSSATAYTVTTTAPITNYNPVPLTAGGGQPRFDHNPTTSESLGLLIEEQRTNLFTYSQNFTDASWVKTGTTVESAVAPDGTLSAAKLSATTSTSDKNIYKAFTTTAQNYTMSLYAKAGGINSLAFYYSSNSTGPYPQFNLSNGTATSGGVMQSVGNGWYKCSHTFTAVSVTNLLAIYINSTSSMTGNGFDGIYIWGAQVEVGSFATSYIPTTTAAATRALDYVEMTGANFSSWFNNGEGTLYSEAKLLAVPGGSDYPGIVKISTDSGNKLGFYTTPTATSTYFSVSADSTSSADMPVAQSPVNSFLKIASVYKVNDFAVSVNASTVGTDTSGIVPVVIKMDIGTYDNIWNGHIKKIAYYPIRVTNAQLQALTS